MGLSLGMPIATGFEEVHLKAAAGSFEVAIQTLLNVTTDGSSDSVVHSPLWISVMLGVMASVTEGSNLLVHQRLVCLLGCETVEQVEALISRLMVMINDGAHAYGRGGPIC